jgi:hypothetical protein
MRFSLERPTPRAEPCDVSWIGGREIIAEQGARP